MEQQYGSRLQERKAAGLFRELPDSQVAGVDFTNNDYLGLSKNPAVVAGAINALQAFGAGGQASRLLGAQAELARELEAQIAESKSESGEALVFATGFQLNTSVISTLLDPHLLGAEPLVFSDRLIHASIHAGIRLAGARQSRFQHNDLNHLESLLRKKSDNRPRFVFVESIYGMDGDRAPLDDLYELKSRYGFHLYVDEAHAVGVAGENGFGLATQSSSTADIVIGTFSKAIGSAGGYLVCSPVIKKLLVNFSPGLIYSTAPAPAALGAALAAWRLLPELETSRIALAQLADEFRQQLSSLNLNFGDSDSHIVPVLIGESERALNISKRLRDRQIHVACIRPPTVPAGTARIRVSLNVGHTQQQLSQLVGGMR